MWRIVEVEENAHVFGCTSHSSLLHPPSQRRSRKPFFGVKASWQGVFSAIPFTAVKAIANSPLGEARMEDKKKFYSENSSRFNALSEKARMNSLWYGEDRPRWHGPIFYEYPSYLNGELPGDYGFDTAGLSQDRVALQKYFNLHARWALLAALGALVPEILDLIGAFHFVEPIWRVDYSKLKGDTIDYLGIPGLHLAGSQGMVIIVIYQALLMELLVTGNNATFVDKFKREMMSVFEMTNLGVMTYFLGMEIKQVNGEVFICPRKNANDIHRNFHMEERKEMATPINQEESFIGDDGTDKVDELLFDAEKSVRCSAVRAVCEWGQLLMALNKEKSKRDWSDTVFVQLCLMTRDMDMKIRVSDFDALGKIQMVSEDILLQTLSKKALESTKEKNYPGHYTVKLLKIPASAAAFTFIHGLQDEFHEVRQPACCAFQTVMAFSSEFTGEAVHILMDILNDDSLAVRLQALETLHHISSCGQLKVDESHLHMFFGSLIDGSPMIRSATRKAIQSIKLQKLKMFRLCVDALMQKLELYPLDEADVFSVLYKIGRNHGKYVANIIQEVFQELEPSFDGKLCFHNTRTAALLVLAISAPVSFEREICSIPPQVFFYYAVTMLGRISPGLVDQLDQNILLAYLSHCSKFTVVSASEFFKGEILDSQPKNSEMSDWIFDGCLDNLIGLKKLATFFNGI